MKVSEKDWFLNYLVQVYDVQELWKNQPTYMISMAVFLLAALMTLIHALRKGGRWPWLWLAIVLHGLVTDNTWHIIVPEFDNFWHSRTPITLLAGRLPLHIIFLYPAFIYHAVHAISKLNLPKFAEPFAVGLTTVLVDIPYDIVAIKFVHWTWHDTDPNIYDRHYWVPWNSYYFHACFATSFYFWFRTSRNWFAPNVEKWKSAGFMAEIKSVFISALLGMPGGVLLFIPIYHPLHDNLKIHSEVTFFLLFGIFLAIILQGLLSDREKSKAKVTTIDYVLLLQLAIHYFIYWWFVVFWNPENEVSVGLHEPIGNCNEKVSLVTPFGQTLYKRKYLCLEDYNEDYFDFHCTKIPTDGDTWYTICGTPFANRAEYIVVLTTIIIVAAGVFYGSYFRTRPAVRPELTSKKLR